MLVGRYFSLECRDSGARKLIDIDETYNHCLKQKEKEKESLLYTNAGIRSVSSVPNHVSEEATSYYLVCITYLLTNTLPPKLNINTLLLKIYQIVYISASTANAILLISQSFHFTLFYNV